MSNLKLKLKRIDPVKAGLIYGITLAAVGFIIFSLAFLFGGLFGSVIGGADALGGILGGGIIALIFVPLLYFVIGFIFGWLGTTILNFVLGKTDGLDLEFDKNDAEIANIGRE